MNIPFTVEQFFDLFGAFNTAIWPSQIAAYVLGALVLALVLLRKPIGGRLTACVLALFWIWNGALYHLVYFTDINPAAWLFGIVFVVQGLLFIVFGVIGKGLNFEFEFRLQHLVGMLFILYATIIYPLLGWHFGHTYPKAPMFGVAPCPTTIFTLGLLLWAKRPMPRILVVIPLFWSLVGMVAAFKLRVPQDYGLPVAGLLGTTLVLLSNRKKNRTEQELR